MEPKVHHRINNSRLPVPTLSHTDPVNAPFPLFKIHFEILPSTPRSSKVSLTLRLSAKTTYSSMTWSKNVVCEVTVCYWHASSFLKSWRFEHVSWRRRRRSSGLEILRRFPHSRHISGQHHQSGHSRLCPNPFRSITHWSSEHSALGSVKYWQDRNVHNK